MATKSKTSANEKMAPAEAATVAKVTAKLTMKMGDLIDAMFATREKKRKLEEQLKGIETEYAGLEEQLMAQLKEQGVDASRGNKASVSVTKSTVGSITDFDALWAYAKRYNYSQLFQRRLSDPAYRELLESGKKVPGVEPFVKERLNLRSL